MTNITTPIAIIDIETGGFSMQKNALCEIGCLIVNPNGDTIAGLQAYIKPYQRFDEPDQQASYKEDAMQINGLTVEKLEAEGADLHEAIRQLVEFLRANQIETIMGHNIERFDWPWIQYFTQKCGYEWYPKTIIDTLKLAKEKHPIEKSYSLQNLCREFKIDTQDQHTATGDIIACFDLYKYLTA